MDESILCQTICNADAFGPYTSGCNSASNASDSIQLLSSLLSMGSSHQPRLHVEAVSTMATKLHDHMSTLT